MRVRCPAGVGQRYDSASLFRHAKLNARLQAFCRHLRVIVLQWLSVAQRVAPMLHLDREVFLPGQRLVLLEYSRCNRTVYVSAQPGNAGVACDLSQERGHRASGRPAFKGGQKYDVHCGQHQDIMIGRSGTRPYSYGT